ncbi:MAG: site-specific integrase [Melioribacteraceae bacterium]
MYSHQNINQILKCHPSKKRKIIESRLNEIKKEADNKILLNHFRIKFLAYSELKHSKNHTKSMKTCLNNLYNKFGNIYLHQITKEMVRTYIEERMKIVSPYAIKRDLTAFSSAFNWAIKKNLMLENLTLNIDRPKLPEKLPLYFTKDEFSKLLEIIDNNDLKELIIFAAYTGIRQSDILNLVWSQINFENQTLILDNRYSVTKSRKVYCLPLHEKVFKILQDRYKNRLNEYVFTYNSRKILQDFICRKFRIYVTNAKLNPSLSFHKLRHSFATWLVKSGVSIYQVSKLLTHSDVKITQIYSHLGVTDLTSAIRMLE